MASNRKSTETITRENLEAWNQVAPIHRQHNHQRLVQQFSQPGFSVLNDLEVEVLNSLEFKGKDVAQICCNNGQELISVKNLGAGRCVGFDGASEFIEEARTLASVANLDVEFVCTDVYDIGSEFSNAFDLTTITIGVLSWMPDLNRFFRIAANLLKPGGALFIYEQHPILEMFEPGGASEPINWELSYFDKSPYIDTNGLDYYGGQTYDAKPVTSFVHTMAEIIMAGVNNSLTVEYFEELPDHISNTWWNIEEANVGLPMSYILILRKSDPA
ncbi:MAG: class I SAM-dependent methyltransferase [Pseudomonadota bacterium]